MEPKYRYINKLLLVLMSGLLSITGVTPAAQAQQPSNMDHLRDSLTRVTETAANDSIKAMAHNNLVVCWLPEDEKKAYFHLALSRKLGHGNKFILGAAMAKEAYIHFYKQDFDAASILFYRADSLLQQMPVKNDYAYRALSDIWNNLAVISQIQNDDYDYTEKIIDKAIPYAEQAGDSVRVATQYVALATMFMNLEQYEKAVPYFQQAQRILEKKTDTSNRLLTLYVRMSENLLLLHQPQEARVILNKAKKIVTDNQYNENESLYLMTEGYYQQVLHQYAQAMTFYDRALKATRGPNRLYQSVEVRFYKLRTLLEMGDYNAAIQLGKSMESDQMVMDVEFNKNELYKHLASAYEKNHNTSLALKYLGIHNRLNDSLHRADFHNKINVLETRYQTAAKEKKITVLEAQKKESELVAKTNRIASWFLGVSCLLLSSLAITIYFYYRNNKRLLLEKEKNHKQQLVELEQREKIKLTQAILVGQENERKRIAQDLHDGVGGTIAGIKINLTRLTNEHQQVVPTNDLQPFVQQLDHSSNELRRIAHNLMPINLLKFGLETALRDLCVSLTTHARVVHFQSYDIDRDLNEQAQLTIYRIVQELLNNIAKHAQANKVMVQCSQDGSVVHIAIDDDGKGFDAQANSVDGMGLRNVKNRIDYLRGTWDIASTVGQGTSINIELNV
ncbi:tetratricopeptide repeat-containing sensor histidine kinase [Sphingobacterium suaedae]|uniref:histidine kinase n=1 Tax=Sphingobacterium suaedae TaxID=1686402 RepID=A0ABW5KIE6_9SPHI